MPRTPPREPDDNQDDGTAAEVLDVALDALDIDVVELGLDAVDVGAAVDAGSGVLGALGELIGDILTSW